MTRNIASASTSYYKDQTSFVLESDAVRAEFVRRGGRMVSLRHKLRGFEFLYQQAGETYVKPEYGKPLTPPQSAGFDDMFPTIDECFCDEDPWRGTVLPDHGEAWSVDWNVTRDGGGLAMSYCGVRLPYRFTRCVSFKNPAVLSMDYRLENLSEFPFSYIWSAHPMLVAPAGARMAFPEECRRAVTVASGSGRIGSYGDEIDWPIHIDHSGIKHDLSLVRGADCHDHEKYFFKNRVTQDWCCANYPEPQLRLSLHSPVDRVPYAAVVLGEGRMYNRDSFLLMEPCTAPFDRVDFSKRHTSESRIDGNETKEWFLNFVIKDGVVG